MKGVIHLQNHFLMFYLIFCCSVVSHALNNSSISSTITCLPRQSSALLRLKQGFALKNLTFTDPSGYYVPMIDGTSYPKMESWKEGKDCCEWDGVTCSKKTGQVVRLDLSTSWLYGPLQSNSSLFSLHHLQRLNLAFNNFTFSRIPSTFGRLSRLTHLNLSYSFFSGHVPSEIALLTNLISLDLSAPFDSPFFEDSSLLYLTMPTLLRNLTNLQELHLDHVNLFSSLLQLSLGNLSSLTYLSLKGCSLQGEFPKNIFQLPQLQVIDVSLNDRLTGTLPDSIGNLKSLRVLELGWCSFSGTLPSSLGNLSQLTELYLSVNNFNGELPHTLGYLKKLESLDVGSNRLSGQIPASLGNLSRLTGLFLDNNSFHGNFPPSLTNLTQLEYVIISYNSLDGVVPSSFFTMNYLFELSLDDNQFTGPLTIDQNISSSQLTVLYARGNKLNGKVPESISRLTKLEELWLDSNNLSGTVDFNIFSEMIALRVLSLSNNSLSITYASTNSTFPKFSILSLSSCIIGTGFPDFLRSQSELEYLTMSNCSIKGKIPKWFFSIGVETLYRLVLSHNFISGWEHAPIILPWKKLATLDLRSNEFQDFLVVPPLSILFFLVSGNKLRGQIHPLFCNLSTLVVLDVSNNLLNGTIPQCLGCFKNALLVLSMKGNNFHGKIPNTFTNGSSLQTLDLSHNKLRGQVPESLINCTALQVLNLGHNQINDTFPLWLQNLLELQVLVLRSNKFHGPIWHPQKFFGFSKLRILDLSFNNFYGNLSPDFFRNWSAITAEIRASNKSQLRYMEVNYYYQDSVSLVVKGLDSEYVKILTIFTSIDLSNNNFQGEIPRTIGELKSLIVLNLSSNNFKGLIPSSLGYLTELESLDLSNNTLSGRIPQELASLSFLEYLNLSDNKLAGPIPQSRHFDTFPSSSFVGNSYLCGLPLLKKCQSTTETQIPDHSQKSESENGFGWKVVVAGYGCGFLVGAIGGHVLFSKKPNLFIRIYGRKM